MPNPKKGKAVATRYYVEKGCTFHVVRPGGVTTITTGPQSLMITSMWRLPNWGRNYAEENECTEISKKSFDIAMAETKKFVEDSLK